MMALWAMSQCENSLVCVCVCSTLNLISHTNCSPDRGQAFTFTFLVQIKKKHCHFVLFTKFSVHVSCIKNVYEYSSVEHEINIFFCNVLTCGVCVCVWCRRPCEHISQTLWGPRLPCTTEQCQPRARKMDLANEDRSPCKKSKIKWKRNQHRT